MIDLSGRSYALPRRKTAVFCVDGCAPAYLDRALAEDRMPRLRRALDAGGLYTRGLGEMPSFTNPNNVSIVTGQPPSVHGISGNTILDRDTGAELPMTDPRFLRVPTLFERLEQAGVRTLCVTAKDKLRALLGAVRGEGPAPISLSAERCAEQSIPSANIASIEAVVGKPAPTIYDPEISAYALEMGLALHERVGARLLYVSLTDYVQHKEAPGGAMSNRFLARFDALLGDYLDAGFLCAFTADHGMNDKTRPDGSPDVRFLEDLLAEAGVASARVVLPITDPYVAHHGALGSYATIYLDPKEISQARALLEAVPGVELVLTRDEAAARFELPADRLGDLVVLGDRRTVLGKRLALHDLSAVQQGLRSHGGLHEREVPIVVCHPLRGGAVREGALRNRDLFDLVLNEIA
ncbi:MAG: phosphonoacetate hydrolase [Minicystis sp.]